MAFKQAGHAARQLRTGRESADRQNSGEQSTGKSADTIFAKYIERVVIADLELEPCTGPEAKCAGDNSDKNHGQHEARRGRDLPSPATAPEIIPRTDGLPRVHHSSAIQVRAPARAARCVATMAMAAREFARSAEPPLKPNQPTHKSPVPITASARS